WLRHIDVPMIISSEKAKAELSWKPKCRTAVDVIRYYAEVVPGRTDRRLPLFFRLISMASRRQELPPDAQRIDARMHLVLTGANGGDFDLELRKGRLRARPGVPRPPTVVVTIPTATFMDLLSGRTD